MPQNFKDKIALVTGATRGLGYHLAVELAKQGAHIIALGRTIGSLEALDDEIKSVGSQATLVPLDLLKLETIDALGPTLFERLKNWIYWSVMPPIWAGWRQFRILKRQNGTKFSPPTSPLTFRYCERWIPCYNAAKTQRSFLSQTKMKARAGQPIGAPLLLPKLL